jgi:hypothetical protein
MLQAWEYCYGCKCRKKSIELEILGEQLDTDLLILFLELQ